MVTILARRPTGHPPLPESNIPASEVFVELVYRAAVEIELDNPFI